jgi:maleylpyruvate isomerase
MASVSETSSRQTVAVPPRVEKRIRLALSGTAFFLRELNGLRDTDLSGAARVEGWTRSMVVADVGYRARALGRLLEGLSGGPMEPEYPTVEYREAEIRYGATLNPLALRHLVEHSAVQLRVLMRDLPPQLWEAEVVDVLGRRISAADIPWLRAQNVWERSIDLNHGARQENIPPLSDLD